MRSSKNLRTRGLLAGVSVAAIALLASGCGADMVSQSANTNLADGKKQYVAKCGACHVLSRAGSKGVTGPNLDSAYRQALADGFPRSTYQGIINHHRPGKDSGALEAAVPSLNQTTAVAKGGALTIDPDPSGQLKYLVAAATSVSGSLTITSVNKASIPHNIALEGAGANAIGPVVQNGGVSKITVTVKVGKYTFYCSVPGHRQAGMEGTLTVK
ncbi:MAG: plastocyanin/azurin family copper-binding protein [Solirubrobacterales bacterium]|nr:plastocyanin/azurin family copper-binding protein [Solirubrobacterales bacterium]